MSTIWRGAPIAILLLGIILPGQAWAQKNNRQKQDERRENQRVSEAEKNVRETQAKVGDAQQELKEALRKLNLLQQQVAVSRNELRDARLQAEDELGKSLGIDQALEELKQAKAELAKVSEPILSSLHKSDAWQKAQAAAEQARQERKELGENVEIDQAAQQARENDLVNIIAQPQELEQTAITSDPAGKRALDRVDKAYAAVRAIRDRVSQDKVNADPKVKRAEDALKKSESEFKQFSRNVTADREKLTKAQQSLANANQKLMQARNADASDRNRKK